MGGGSPSVPDPAKRPERVVEVEAEDIILGTDEDLAPSKRGRKRLTKPTGQNTTGVLTK